MVKVRTSVRECRGAVRLFPWITAALLALMMLVTASSGGSALASPAATPVAPSNPTWSIDIGYSGYDQMHLDNPVTLTVTIRGSGLAQNQLLNFTTSLPASVQSLVTGTSCTPTVAGSTCSFGSGGFSGASADTGSSVNGVVAPAASGNAGAVVGFTISGLDFLDPLLGAAACLHVDGPDGVTTTCSDILVVPADAPTVAPTIVTVDPTVAATTGPTDPLVTPTTGPVDPLVTPTSGPVDPLITPTTSPGATGAVPNGTPEPVTGNARPGNTGGGSSSTSGVVGLPNTGTASTRHDDTLSYILIGVSLILVISAAGVALNRRQS